jgi:prephenate dehydratase
MRVSEVAYLGPEGTYSHLVSEKRYGRQVKLVPCPSIVDVFGYASEKASRHAVVPIENSSGGTVYETVDMLLSGRYDLRIEEQLDLNVKLALLGLKGEKIRILYSHFAPLIHCDSWIRRHLPDVERREVPSTALAAREAATVRYAAAIASRRAARIYRLKVLHYPLEEDVPNVTQFFALARTCRKLKACRKTTFAVHLPNRPGSLCSFLEPFRDQGVNLSRIVSRPIPGRPSEYAFFVDIDGIREQRTVKTAIEAASRTGAHLRVIGSYPVRCFRTG